MGNWGQGSYKNGNKNSAAQRRCRFEGVEGRSAREISESSLLQTGGRTGTAVWGSFVTAWLGLRRAWTSTVPLWSRHGPALRIPLRPACVSSGTHFHSAVTSSSGS